jgi:hypothetical protein
VAAWATTAYFFTTAASRRPLHDSTSYQRWMQCLFHAFSVMSSGFSFDAFFLHGLMYDLFSTFSFKGMATMPNSVQ